MISRLWIFTAIALKTLACSPAGAGTLSTLFAFDNTNGATPTDAPVLDASGNAYVALAEVGRSCFGNIQGCGTLERLSHGAAVTLVRFDGSNGIEPGPLTIHGQTLYGTTLSGPGNTGTGTVYKVSTNGSGFVLLHSFSDQEGDYPQSLIVTDDGTVYGVTLSGGPFGHGDAGFGALFKIAPDGTYTPLHNFTGRADGGFPDNIVMDNAGTIYGGTESGAFLGSNVAATLYSYADGALVGLTAQVLYSFSNDIYHALAGFGTNTNSIAPSDVNGPPVVLRSGQVLGTSSFGGHRNCGFAESTCGTLWLYTP
jgi:uncharacterized repeat protein (TIGR03803 family)